MSTPARKKTQDSTGHDFIEIISLSRCTRMTLRFYLIVITLVVSAPFLYSQEIDSIYLKQLGKQRFDSVRELTERFNNGKIKSKTKYLFTHYYKFNNQPKHLTIVCLQQKEIYSKAGVLVERLTLHPFDSEISWYFYVNGGLKKIDRYLVKKGTNDINNISYSSLEKIREAIVLPSGERKIIWEQLEYKKHKAYKQIYGFSFGEEEFIQDNPYKKNVKYWLVRKKKKHFEITIWEPKNDSLICTLNLPFNNEFVDTDNPSKIKYWLAGVRIHSVDKNVATFFDKKIQLSYIVDFSFRKIFNQPVKNLAVVTSTQGDEYFWVCNDTCALISKKGKEIIPFAKQTLASNKGDFLKILTKEGYSAFNLSGKRVLPFTKNSDAFELASNNVAIVRVGLYEKGRVGQIYINLVTKDTLKIKAGYPFVNEFAVSKQDENRGVTNSSGEWVIKPNKRINNIELTDSGNALIELDEPIWTKEMTRALEHRYMFYNLKQKRGDTLDIRLRQLRNNPKYSLSLESKLGQDFFENGYALIEVTPDEGKSNLSSRFFTLMDLKGNLIDVQNRYDEIENGFSQYGQAIAGMKKMVQGKKREYELMLYGVIDKNGDEIIPCEYGGLKLTKYGYIAHTKDFKYGLIGFDGEFIIKPETTSDDVDFQLKKADNPFLYSITIPIGAPVKK